MGLNVPSGFGERQGREGTRVAGSPFRPASSLQWKSGGHSGQGWFRNGGARLKGPGTTLPIPPPPYPQDLCGIGRLAREAACNFLERLLRTESDQTVPVGVATWAGEGASGAGRRMAGGLGSSALVGEGASPRESEKLGVPLFPGRGVEVERPGYCVLRVHMLLPEEKVSPLGAGTGGEPLHWGERGGRGCPEGVCFWPPETWS